MGIRPTAASLAPVPTRPLSRPNRQLTALAEIAARCARQLLPDTRDLFLSITLDANEVLQLRWWRRDLTPCAEMSAPFDGFCSADSAEGALQHAGIQLLHYLSGRWPENAIPDGVGVITDGYGVAFSPKYPSPLTSDWLIRHAAGNSGIVTILPLSSGGPCSLLHHPAASARVH